MSKVYVLLTAIAVVVYAEPPLDQSLSRQYGAPSGAGVFTGQQGTGPSSQYGAPGAESFSPNAHVTGNHASLQHVEAPSGSGYNKAGVAFGQENSEPVSYEFQYDVEDQEQALQFGHKENREGDLATGQYYVLLPDGRIQKVEYQADENGYRPKISYEVAEEGYSRGGPDGYNNRGHDEDFNGGYQF